MRALSYVLKAVHDAEALAESSSAPDILLNCFESAKSAVSEAALSDSKNPHEFCEIMERALNIIKIIESKTSDEHVSKTALAENAFCIAAIADRCAARCEQSGPNKMNAHLANRFRNIEELGRMLAKDILDRFNLMANVRFLELLHPRKSGAGMVALAGSAMKH